MRVDNRPGVAEIDQRNGGYWRLRILFDNEHEPIILRNKLYSRLEEELKNNYPNIHRMSKSNFEGELTLRTGDCSSLAF